MASTPRRVHARALTKNPNTVWRRLFEENLDSMVHINENPKGTDQDRPDGPEQKFSCAEGNSIEKKFDPACNHGETLNSSPISTDLFDMKAESPFCSEEKHERLTVCPDSNSTLNVKILVSNKTNSENEPNTHSIASSRHEILKFSTKENSLAMQASVGMSPFKESEGLCSLNGTSNVQSVPQKPIQHDALGFEDTEGQCGVNNDADVLVVDLLGGGDSSEREIAVDIDHKKREDYIKELQEQKTIDGLHGHIFQNTECLKKSDNKLTIKSDSYYTDKLSGENREEETTVTRRTVSEELNTKVNELSCKSDGNHYTSRENADQSACKNNVKMQMRYNTKRTNGHTFEDGECERAPALENEAVSKSEVGQENDVNISVFETIVSQKKPSDLEMEASSGWLCVDEYCQDMLEDSQEYLSKATASEIEASKHADIKFGQGEVLVDEIVLTKFDCPKFEHYKSNKIQQNTFSQPDKTITPSYEVDLSDCDNQTQIMENRSEKDPQLENGRLFCEVNIEDTEISVPSDGHFKDTVTGFLQEDKLIDDDLSDMIKTPAHDQPPPAAELDDESTLTDEPSQSQETHLTQQPWQVTSADCDSFGTAVVHASHDELMCGTGQSEPIASFGSGEDDETIATEVDDMSSIGYAINAKLEPSKELWSDILKDEFKSVAFVKEDKVDLSMRTSGQMEFWSNARKTSQDELQCDIKSSKKSQRTNSKSFMSAMKALFTSKHEESSTKQNQRGENENITVPAMNNKQAKPTEDGIKEITRMIKNSQVNKIAASSKISARGEQGTQKEKSLESGNKLIFDTNSTRNDPTLSGYFESRHVIQSGHQVEPSPFHDKSSVSVKKYKQMSKNPGQYSLPKSSRESGIVLKVKNGSDPSFTGFSKSQEFQSDEKVHISPLHRKISSTTRKSTQKSLSTDMQGPLRLSQERLMVLKEKSEYNPLFSGCFESKNIRNEPKTDYTSPLYTEKKSKHLSLNPVLCNIPSSSQESGMVLTKENDPALSGLSESETIRSDQRTNISSLCKTSFKQDPKHPNQCNIPSSRQESGMVSTQGNDLGYLKSRQIQNGQRTEVMPLYKLPSANEKPKQEPARSAQNSIPSKSQESGMTLTEGNDPTLSGFSESQQIQNGQETEISSLYETSPKHEKSKQYPTNPVQNSIPSQSQESGVVLSEENDPTLSGFSESQQIQNGQGTEISSLYETSPQHEKSKQYPTHPIQDIITSQSQESGVVLSEENDPTLSGFGVSQQIQNDQRTEISPLYERESRTSTSTKSELKSTSPGHRQSQESGMAFPEGYDDDLALRRDFEKQQNQSHRKTDSSPLLKRTSPPSRNSDQISMLPDQYCNESFEKESQYDQDGLVFSTICGYDSFDMESETEKQLDATLSENDIKTVSTISREDLNLSSIECLLEQLIRRGKVETAFVMDLEGRVIAHSLNTSVSCREARGFYEGLQGHYYGMIRLEAGEEPYICFKSTDDSMLVGRSKSHVTVSKKGDNAIVVGFSRADTSGSCIVEMTELLQVISGRGL